MLVALTLLAAVPPAAGAKTPQWWGPTEMLDGWHVRIPVQVTNTRATPLREATVGYDLPLGSALIEAGWISSRNGDLQNFELDPASIRVVEYRALGTNDPFDGLVIGEVPSRAWPGLLGATSAHDAKARPDVHVEWLLPKITGAGASRFFMIYVDSTTQGRKPSATLTEAEAGPLEARYWISKGTELYGRGAEVNVVGLDPETQFHVESFQFGKAIAVDSGRGAEGFPIGPGEISTVSVGADALIRVRSNKPVLAYGSGNGHEIVGPIPSADGHLVGSRFVFADGGRGFVVLAPTGASTTVQVDGISYTLNKGRPALRLEADASAGPIRTVTTTDPDRGIIVLAALPTSGKTQAPSVWGAPAGSRLVMQPFRGEPCGNCEPRPPCSGRTEIARGAEVKLLALEDDVFVRGRDIDTDELKIPTKPGSQDLQPAARISRATPTALATRAVPNPCPVEFYTVAAPDEVRYEATGSLFAYGGQPRGVQPDFVRTPLGGEGGARVFPLPTAVSIVAPYDGTRVQIRAAGELTVDKGLARGSVLEWSDVQERTTAWLESSKPVVLVPTRGGGYFAGIDSSLSVAAAGQPQYRGYLVGLEPRDGGPEPMIGNAGPGKPITYRLLLRNLALDDRGQGVQDTVRLSLSPLSGGWTATLSEEVVPLPPRGTREIAVTLTPPDTAAQGERMAVVVTATSGSNPASFDAVPIAALVRASYGVRLWFDLENGPSAKTLTFDEGATRSVRVVLKSLASVPDRFLLRFHSLADDWSVALQPRLERLVEIALDPGEIRLLDVVVGAPRENATQSIAEISAVSLTDGRAADKISATLRVRPDLRMAIETDATIAEVVPGSSVRFVLRIVNRGTDAIGVRFNASGALPLGWEAPRTLVGGHVLDELTGIPRGGHATIQLAIDVPRNASRSDRLAIQFLAESLAQFVGDPIVRETEEFVVLVAARHELRLIDDSSLKAIDPEGLVHAKLTLVNEGNGEEKVRLDPVVLPPRTSYRMDPSTVIPMNAEAKVRATFALDNATPPGIHPISMKVLTEDGHAEIWAFNVSVPDVRRADVALVTPATSIAGTVARVTFEIRNAGNVPLELPPRLVENRAWTTEWMSMKDVLRPGERMLLEANLSIARDTPEGPTTIPFDPGWADAPSIEWAVRRVELAGVLDVEDSGRVLVVTVENRGTGDAHDVDVVLRQGEQEVDRATLKRLAAGSKGLVTFRPPAGPASVEIDSHATYSETPIVLALTARPAPVPAPPLALLIVLAVGAALLGRRGH